MKKLQLIENQYENRALKDKTYQSFLKVINNMNLSKYLKNNPYCFETRGRKPYDKLNLLTAILFASMNGIKSLRKMEDVFSYDTRFISILNEDQPTYVTISNFISDNLLDSIHDIMTDMIMSFIDLGIDIDLNTLYIDGTKIEASSNKYTWVWKKACIKFRDRLYIKISKDLKGLQRDVLDKYGILVNTKTEYYIEDIKSIVGFLDNKKEENNLKYVYGKGRKKSKFQSYHDKFKHYYNKLESYAIKIDLCGEFRNSYSKTDIDATFMRIKRDYMGNDALLPAYNLQAGVSDFFITHADVYQYASDSSTFVPFMEGYKKTYGFYPKYPVGDAGYGSFNNLIYCERNNMKKYLKFPSYKRETHDKKYIKDPFRVKNFKILEDGSLLCPNNKRLVYWKEKAIANNKYGRTTELYRCVDCKGCNYKERCMKKASNIYNNKVIQTNQEMTKYNEEVINNLGSPKGIRLRINRSIQSEGAFGDIKSNYGYNRCRRKGIKKVRFEMIYEAIGHNLRRYRNIIINKEQHDRDKLTIDSRYISNKVKQQSFI